LVKLPENFSVLKARKIQKFFAEKVLFKEIQLDLIERVGGVDVSYRKEDAVAAVAVLDYKTLNVLEVKKTGTKIFFPYVPTLLSFREAPPVFKVFMSLKKKPDVLLVDGHGIAHPYGCGLASHVGVVLKVPTVGVAKKLLCGEVGKFLENKAPIIYKDRIVGMALVTKPGTKPIYVSVGNMLTLNQAVEIVQKCVKNNRLPEPLRIAHLLTKNCNLPFYK